MDGFTQSLDLWFTLPVSAFCAGSVLLLMYWAYSKPSGVYCGPDDEDSGEQERLRTMQIHQFRSMLSSAKTEDDATEAVLWALFGLRLSVSEVVLELESMKPLCDPHEQAALAVRREHILQIAG